MMGEYNKRKECLSYRNCECEYASFTFIMGQVYSRTFTLKCYMHSILNKETEYFEKMDANELCRKISGS